MSEQGCSPHEMFFSSRQCECTRQVISALQEINIFKIQAKSGSYPKWKKK